MTYLMGGPRDGASEAGGCYHGSAALCKASRAATAACLHGDPSLNPPPSDAAACAAKPVLVGA
jgi:hypothetical protein